MIKKAAPKDLKAIMSLIRLNSDTFSESEIPQAKKHIKELIYKSDRDNKFFIKISSNKIVGCAGYSKQDDTCGVYFLNWLAVFILNSKDRVLRRNCTIILNQGLKH